MRPIQPRTRVVEAGLITTSDVPDHLTEWRHSLHRARTLNDYHLIDESESGLGLAAPDLDPLDQRVQNHRSGTCFDVESTEMREACVDSINALLDTDAVVHEVRHQRRECHTDLVYADVDLDGLRGRDRMTVGREPLHDPLQRFRVWCYIRSNGPKSKGDAIENGRYSSASKNRRHVEWLLDHGYLAENERGFLTALTPPKIADLHAVELKRRDWEKALEQAKIANTYDQLADYMEERPGYRDRYGYADYRWVALDAGAIDAALEHAHRFREEGVGLLAITEGGAVVKHVDAEHEPRRRYTRDRAYVESQVWERLALDEWLGASDGTIERFTEDDETDQSDGQTTLLEVDDAEA